MKGKTASNGILILLMLLTGTAWAQLALESGTATSGGDHIDGGELSVAVAAGETATGRSTGGSFTVVGGVQTAADTSILFRDGFE